MVLSTAGASAAPPSPCAPPFRDQDAEARLTLETAAAVTSGGVIAPQRAARQPDGVRTACPSLTSNASAWPIDSSCPA
jgi:hypothetical protein